MFSDYLREMVTKWGFNDGELVPRDAEAAREVMVKIIAAWLKRNYPEYKVKKFDRTGFHNWCMVLFTNGKGEYVDVPGDVYSFLANQFDDRFNRLVPMKVGKINQMKLKAEIAIALQATI